MSEEQQIYKNECLNIAEKATIVALKDSQNDQPNEQIENEKDEAIVKGKEPTDHFHKIQEKKEYVKEKEVTEKIIVKEKTEKLPKNESSFVDSSELSSTKDIQQQQPKNTALNFADICNLEKITNEIIKEIVENDEFFHCPLESILSSISKMDFRSIDEKNERIKCLKNIISKTIDSHEEEKETILILQNIDISQFDLAYERILSIFEMFTNCPILQQFCKLYKDKEILPERDFQYDLEQKDIKINKLKQAN